jgi:hypothetical protein
MEGSTMRRLTLLLIPLLLAGQSAFAQSSGGNSALALAALVAAPSPLLNAQDKKVMAHMLDGNLTFTYPANKKIVVKSAKVTCRASNVDISAHSCELTFGGATRNLTGRGAHELYATLIESGVPSDGAAGSLFESVTQLACTIDPNAVKERAGGGADCTFTAGP